MFATFDIDAALTDYEFEQGMIEKVIEKIHYLPPSGTWFDVTFIASTNAKYARVRVENMDGDENTIREFGGAIRHYLYTSNKASGPIRGRKIINEGWINSIGYASVVEYIIDNPFYTAN